MLNKITGCDSRTVPPLYVLVPVSTGESRSLGEDPGKAEIGGPQSQGTSQKTYEVVSPIACVLWAVCLSQKNGCGVFVGRRSLFDFLEVL